MHARSIFLKAVACAALLAAATASPAHAAAARGPASGETLAQMSASTTYRASQGAMWAWSQDPAWICSLVPSCMSAERIVGPASETIKMEISLQGTGLPLPSGLASIPVTLEISNRVAGSSLDMAIHVENPLGDFTSQARLTMAPSGLDDARTRLTYKTLSANGSGLTGTTVMKVLSDTLPAQLESSSAKYYEYVKLDPVTKLTVRAQRTNAKTGKTPVQVTATTTFPAGFTAPTASGTVRMYVSGKLRCTTRMTGSRASCVMSLPARKITTVMAVLNGNLSSGTPVVTGANGYIKAGARR